MLSKQPVSNQCCRTAHLAILPGAEVSVMLSLSHASRHRFYQPCCCCSSSSFCLCISFVLSAFTSVLFFLRVYQFRSLSVCIASFSLRLHQFRSLFLRLRQFRLPRFQPAPISLGFKGNNEFG